ncbi:uncharacterized protein LOC141699961 [Apium graveolens]|uniref:uncharacterized protein LOC141699961 n=1 Tax=Apium graveolens TaxID=4045 RepID=UPI003D7B2E20
MVLHSSISPKKKQELIHGTRDVPPADFLLKIESFSKLPELINNQKKKYYESCCFEAGGFNWRFRLLVLRANRVQEKKIISVYLVLDESNVLPTGSDVIANFKFFIYTTRKTGSDKCFNPLSDSLKTRCLLSRRLLHGSDND